jgi:hypothetical protein
VIIERSPPAVRAKELASFVANMALSAPVAVPVEGRPATELTPEGIAFMERARALVEPAASGGKPILEDFVLLVLEHVPRLFDTGVSDYGTPLARTGLGWHFRCASPLGDAPKPSSPPPPPHPPLPPVLERYL